MTSKRKAKRQLERWFRYFRKYEPWHMSTPGLERAYDCKTRAFYAKLRQEK